MAKRPTSEMWLAARQQWEADPKENFETIGRSLGVSRVASSKRASKEGWARPQNLRQIVERAQLQADVKVSPKPLEVSDVTGKTTEQAAVDIRADVLKTHRQDWHEHRSVFTLLAIADDLDAGKKAKISADMLIVRQKGERAAYGLDDSEAAGKTVEREMSDLEIAHRLAYILQCARDRQDAERALSSA